MRSLLLFTVSCCIVASVYAAPHCKRKIKHKAVATPHPIPLSPSQLRGKVVYVSGRDVWAMEPESRRKFLLYKDLFFPANKSPNAYVETYGGGISFSRADIAWSADLMHVAFIYRDPRFQGSELFVMRWDGKEKRQFSNGKYEDVLSYPRWSPDGQSIMFMRSGPYRMGGPGYGYRNVVIARLDGKPVGINTRDDSGQPITGTFFNPFWSRDGSKVLLDYSPQDADYIETVTPKVASLDATPLANFKDNWSDFLVDNQSPNGQWRLKHLQYPRPGCPEWELRIDPANQYKGTVLRENNGLNADRFCIKNDGAKLVWQGNLTDWSVASTGEAKSTDIFGIWMSGTFRVNTPNLLVKNGQLVNWF